MICTSSPSTTSTGSDALRVGRPHHRQNAILGTRDAEQAPAQRLQHHGEERCRGQQADLLGQLDQYEAKVHAAMLRANAARRRRRGEVSVTRFHHAHPPCGGLA